MLHTKPYVDENMKPKVIFIINSIQQQRCIKRIEEFIANGYEVQAYGFSRSDIIPTLPKNFHIEILGHIDNHTSYFKRLIFMYKALRPVLKHHAKDSVLYYYFLLDIALVCRLLCRKPYIYEESDLMQTYLPSAILRNLLNRIDKHIIHHSLITTMTSDGFAQYHFGTDLPDNIVIVPNRLNKKVLQLPYKSSTIDINHLRFAFVGGARFDAVVNFVNTLAAHFPQHDFHFYGTILDHKSEFEGIMAKYSNVYFHGKFSNPIDLPSIYQNIDLVLATYDTKYENVRYAEPNKLYEAIYFETPILVSSGTYLAEKVKRLGVGYDIDAMDDESIISFIRNLTKDGLLSTINNIKKIDKQSAININTDFFQKLDTTLKGKDFFSL